MVKTWKKPEEEIIREGSIMEAGLAGIEAIERAVPSNYEKLPLAELRNYSPSKFVKTQQRWCNQFIAESYSGVDINKEKIKQSFRIILNAINNNSTNEPFDIENILDWTGAKNLSDGTIQRKILSWMVCLGIVKMNHMKIKNKNGKERIKYVFIKNPQITQCVNLINGKCNFDWKNASLTDYFPPEYKKQSEVADFEEDD